MLKQRLAVAALTLSAAGFVGLAVSEGYTDTAKPPVPGDVPTYGFGSTTDEHGRALKAGAKTDPVRALIRAQKDVSAKEAAVRKCLDGARFTQGEWDIYIDHAYNVGPAAFCGSQMAGLIRQARYADACNQFPRWKYFQGKDCSLPANKRLCGGLWTRRLEAQAHCLGEQQ